MPTKLATNTEKQPTESSLAPMFARPYSTSTIRPLATTQKKLENSSAIESQKEIKKASLISARPASSRSYHKKMHSKKISKSCHSPSVSPAANAQYQPPLKWWLSSLLKPTQKVHVTQKNSSQKKMGFDCSAAPVMTRSKGVIHTQLFTARRDTIDSEAKVPMILFMAVQATTRCLQALGKISSTATKATTS